MTKHETQPPLATMPAALDTAQAALYVGLAPKTLGNLRTIGGGPRYVKYGRRAVRYLRADLDMWMEAKRIGSTSERAAA